MNWKLFWLACCLFFAFSQPTLGETKKAPTNILFVNPGFADESFWHDVDLYAQAAARHFDYSLEIIHGNRDHILVQQLLADRMTKQPTPDYVILVNEKNSGLALLNTLESSDCYVSLALNDFSPPIKQSLLTNPNWKRRLLPGVIPNNFNIGYLTARDLYQQGKQTGSPSTGSEKNEGNYLLISGDKNTPASNDREAGALSFIMQTEKVDLAQRVYGNWREDTAYSQAKVLLNRHPQTRYIWTANDHMAFGVQRALNETGLKVGTDVFLSTVNTSERVLDNLKQGKISSLGGGHFTAVGLLITKIHYHNSHEQWPQRTKFNLFHLIRYPSTLFDLLKSKQWERIDFDRIDIANNPVDAFKVKEE
ncbi:ABC transporter substrate-binding protein [Vibrio hangzhouensis]|uniref:Autoinducer 2-binding periplasmic protein LuxP n=1 Tax=Vibrio hangzhouensis TaxID=462991 RepID=A0A1H6A691_9VIBR|nr:ABC transporter substrate-binding protein [Vibrio hangzhouensis]SEG43860.1 substrate-binding protein domain-containing protein [Vibrio hangzhouensis]